MFSSSFSRFFLKPCVVTLAGVSRWLERRLVHKKLGVLFLSGHMLALGRIPGGAHPQWVCVCEAIGLYGRCIFLYCQVFSSIFLEKN